MVQFHHSLFALPFALSAMLVAAQGIPRLWTLGWIVVACVAARTMAMTYNRIADRDVDALNPRTSSRALPAGQVSLGFAWGFAIASAAVFILSAAMLNRLCLVLSPVALAVLLGYSHWKRFARGSHLILGAALGIAPIGSWIAVLGTFSDTPLWLAAGVMFWTAGFDIIYACLDVDFDRKQGLHSLPARIGIARALWRSAGMHILALVCFAIFAWRSGLGLFGWSGIVLSVIILFFEHRIVSPRDLSRVGPAFFTFNAVVSVVFFLACALDILI